MKQKILIVDDEVSILQSLSGILEDEGYEVIVAACGEEGLERAKKDQPDLIILDIWMPGTDGITVLEEIKKLYPLIPVMIISGHGTIETAVKATRMGAFDFIEKPLSIERVPGFDSKRHRVFPPGRRKPPAAQKIRPQDNR